MFYQSNDPQLAQSENKQTSIAQVIIDNAVRVAFGGLIWFGAANLATLGSFEPSYMLGVRDTLVSIITLTIFGKSRELYWKYKKSK